MPKLLYDVTLRKCGCVLLQAVAGGSIGIANRIPAEDWLVAPTPDMKLYELTDDQVDQLVAMHKGMPRGTDQPLAG